MKYTIRFITGTVLVLMVVLYACASLDKSLQSYTMPPNVEQYFQDKYKTQINEVKCDFQETPQGPRGHLSLKGRIELNNQIRVIADDDNSARALAKSFFQEEAGILGIVDLNEWQDTLIIWTTDYYGDRPKKGIRKATITYSRFINGMLFSGDGYFPWIRMNITEYDSVNSFEAYLAPAPTEVYKAVKKKMISEAEAIRCVEQELTAEGMSFSKITMAKAKHVVDKPPYVRWTSDITTKEDKDYWLRYTLNALTGEIVFKEKVSRWIQ